MTGILSSTQNRGYHQIAADGVSVAEESFEVDASKVPTGPLFGYSNDAYPNGSLVSESDVYNVYFFDNYYFLNSSPQTHLGFNSFDNNQRLEVSRGLPIGSKTKVFGGSNPSQMLATVSYYDERARPLQSITENHKGR